MSRDSDPEKYRATRMWNDVVRTLRSSMPVGRHRKNMRVYLDCFVASHAVDWLHQHLRMNPNFAPDISRSQTIALLRKFQKMGIIQDARGPDHKHANDPFDNNGRLFVVTSVPLHSPGKKFGRCMERASLTRRKGNATIRRSPLKEVNRRDLLDSSPAAWRHSVPSWIGGKGDADCDLVPCESEVELSIPYMDEGVSPYREDEPAPAPAPAAPSPAPSDANCGGADNDAGGETHLWLDIVLYRLRCLLRLKSLDDVISELETLNSCWVRHNFLNVSKNGLVTNIEKTEHLPYWILSSMKFLAQGRPEDNLLTLPGALSGLKPYCGLEKDIFSAVRDYFVCLPDPLIPLPFYDLFVNVLVHADNFAHVAAGGADSASAPHLPCPSPGPLPDADPDPGQGRSPRAGVEELSSSCAEMMQQMGRTPADGPRPVLFKVPAVPARRGLRRAVPQVVDQLETSFDGADVGAVTRRRHCSRRWSVGPAAARSERQRPPLPLPADTPKRPPAPFSPGLGWSPRFRSESDVRGEAELPENQLARQTAAGRTPGPRRSASFHAALHARPADAPWSAGPAPGDASSASSVASSASAASAALLPLPCEREELLAACLQLCCLLLPPGRRRRLHLLLRFMRKTAARADLRLAGHEPRPDPTDPAAATRDLVICSFAETILRRQAPQETDQPGAADRSRSGASVAEARDVFALQLVGFMMDHYPQIMAVPDDLKAAIERRIGAIVQAQLRSTGETPLPRPFCRQLSTTEFEAAREANSTSALASLLESIIADPKLTSKERKRRLKQFKETHPSVYARKFPTAEKESDYLSSLPKSSVLDWTLQKLRNIRL